MTTQKLKQQLITQYASALADTSDNSFRRKNYLEMMNQAIYKLDILKQIEQIVRSEHTARNKYIAISKFFESED